MKGYRYRSPKRIYPFLFTLRINKVTHLLCETLEKYSKISFKMVQNNFMKTNSDKSYLALSAEQLYCKTFNYANQIAKCTNS